MRELTSRITTALLAAAMIFGLAGCSEDAVSSSESVSSSTVQSVVESTPEPTEAPATTPTSAPTATPEPSLEPTPEPVRVTLAEIPAYSGESYVAINGNVPYFSDAEMTTDSFEDYSPLDSLGRCGVAYACVGTETMPTEKRGSIGQIKPSGWRTVKYDFVDGKYLFNRCHLIGYQLTAENANERNLITGTRALNIDGMLPFENMTADYIKETGNHVLYRVTPMFDGNDLVAKGVLIEAKSVEDNGDGILFCVFAYNVQPGVTIDYATGDNEADGTQGGQSSTTTATAAPTESAVAATPTPEPVVEQAPQGTTYILNTNTKKFHYPSCGSVKQMKESNKQSYTGSRDDVIAMGYVPCKKCNP